MQNQETKSSLGSVQLAPCPHCHAGTDGIVLGLVWDLSEDAWRCIHCGHRSYMQRKRSDTEILEDKVWEEVLASLSPDERDSEWTENEEDGLI